MASSKSEDKLEVDVVFKELRSRTVYNVNSDVEPNVWLALKVVASESREKSPWMAARMACVSKSIICEPVPVPSYIYVIGDLVQYGYFKGDNTTVTVLDAEHTNFLFIRKRKWLHVHFFDHYFSCSLTNLKTQLLKLADKHPKLFASLQMPFMSVMD